MTVLFVVGAFAVMLLRLWFLQILKGPDYRIQSENNRIHLQDIPPFRGMLFDRNGALLVDNRPAYNLYVIPEDIQDPRKLSESLESLLGFRGGFLEEKLRTSFAGYSFRPLLLKKNMSRHELAVIETNLYSLPGLVIEVRPQRHYIYGRFASHVIGYLGEISESELKSRQYPDNRMGDLIGKAGVEGKWQNSLNGLRGGEQVEVDAAGRKLRVITRKAPVPGQNIALTLDKDLQEVAENALEGKNGAIVALDPNNGEVLALVSSPDFDPNDFIGGIEEAQWKAMVSGKTCSLQNRAITGQYPPGSVFKIVVALGGLEEGLIRPEEEVVCPGRYMLGSHTFRCWKRHGHGRVNLQRALTESCDVYFYRLGRRLGVDRIALYAQMLGLGKKSGFELGGESSGLIPTSSWKLKRWGIPWQAGETISTSIGQSFVLATPLQIANMIAAVFNGGYLYRPKVILWVGKENEKADTFSPSFMGRIKAKQENLALIRDALVGVVSDPRGTGGRARIPGIVVAGKTGTAQVISFRKEHAFSRDGELPLEFRDHAWFAAVAPAREPRLALAVLVEHGGHGGSAAAPLAKEVIAAYMKKCSRPLENKRLERDMGE
jgi:penicillin-binding protein 2